MAAYAGSGAALFVAVHIAIAEASAQSPRRDAERFPVDNGVITVSSVGQMSVVIESPDGVIYTDPTGGGARYSDHPAPDIILISHEHHEHYDERTLEELVGPDTRIVVPPYVMERLPESLRGSAVSLANGERVALGRTAVDAIPSYGIGGEARRWHPRGRGNGYVVTVDGRRIYVAGSTDAIPEMLQLEDIDLAFLPLYPPYAMDPASAAFAVSRFKPRFAYIYQYDAKRTRDHLVQLLDDASSGVRLIAPDIDP